MGVCERLKPDVRSLQGRQAQAKAFDKSFRGRVTAVSVPTGRRPGGVGSGPRGPCGRLLRRLAPGPPAGPAIDPALLLCPRRLERQRAGIVAAGEFHQRRDARRRPTDGCRKYWKIPRADCRCTFPSRRNWRAAISPRPSILRSAEIMASGFLVSSTEPASARYSRWRDSAKRMTIDRIQATTISASAMTMAMPAPPLRVAVAAAKRRPPP